MIRRTVVFSPEARTDLLTLYDWIADATTADVALGYIGRLEQYIASFEVASERGVLRDDIRPGLRIVGFERRVTVAFAVVDDAVVILRLFYAGRDWSAAFDAD